jgi:hypothetical protein
VRRPLLLLICVISSALCSKHAVAWDYKGHRVVGSIADQLLRTRAKEEVAIILGFELRIAGPWADCVKSVVQIDANTYAYKEDPAHPEYEIPCTSFRTAPEQLRMENYVKRNWTQCVYPETGPQRGCHNTYHFDDVAVQRDRFDRMYKGTNEHDLVAAITAAIAVLRDQTPSGPFSIADKKEALFMLAHFIGDLHQPLHVGSVYLGSHGERVDPDASGGIDPATDTQGGNRIALAPRNMHYEWDGISVDLGEAATKELLDDARSQPSSTGAIETWPVAWATDTLLVARRAFAGTTFMETAALKWSVSFDDRAAYLAAQDAIKRKQLAKAGARMAELLNAIWP